MSDPTAIVSPKGTAAPTEVALETIEADAPGPSAEPELPEIFVAAQRGDMGTLSKLLADDPSLANAKDAQGITPLHWAAINAHMAACRLLLDNGAEVDAKGGDLVATPMQWAARNGHLYVLQLLISHGADPSIEDAQGYNTLHLVTHSSAIMPLLYMLHQPVAVDHPDSQGHTALMWAAYQGDALSVQLLLAHGASVHARDHAQLTALHWAVVRGNHLCIKRLLEAGADVNARDGQGKTPREMAAELKSEGPWRRACREAKRTEDGRRRKSVLSERNTKIAVFLVPSLFFYIIFTTISLLPWYTGLCLAAAEFFGMHHVVTKVLLDAPPSSTVVTGSPYFAGIIFGSLVFVGWEWVTVLVRSTPGYSITNLGFGLCFLLCCYNFFRSVTLEPGACPKPADEAELKAIIEELASEGRLNGQTFCVVCMARKPLRSKHCRVCERCTARFDHHCPWVWNCVGVSNHRQFIMFILTLVIGVLYFDFLVYAYFTQNVSRDAIPPASCILPTTLCSWTSQEPFLTAVAVWATLQLLWTSLLLVAQLWQVTKQVTTFEVSNLSRFGFMGGRGTSAQGQEGLTHPKQGQNLMGDDEPNPDGIGGHPVSDGPSVKHQHRSSAAFVLQLLGLDRFTAKSNRRALVRSSPNSNPFDQGVWRNCLDFWTTGRELGVEYGSLYEVPAGGFTKKAGEDSGRRNGKGRRGGYEPVQSEEV